MSEQALDPFLLSEIRNDATLVNAITQMGTGGDRSEYTKIGNPQKIAKIELERLYKIPICRRIVRAIPDSAVLKGWNLSLGQEEDKDLLDFFEQEQLRLGIAESFNEAQVLANIYGGAAIIIVADDGRPANEPLNEKKLKKIIIFFRSFR